MKKRGKKTAVLTIRISDRRRFELELIAAALPGSSSMTGVVEWAIDTACANTPELADITKVWSPFESDRFVRMADFYPDTLDQDQALLWQFILSKRVFWPLHPREGAPHAAGANFVQGFNFRLLRDSWDMLKAHMAGAPWDETAFTEICKAHGLDSNSQLVTPDVPEET